VPLKVPTPTLLVIQITGNGIVQKWSGLLILDIRWRRVVTFMCQLHYPGEKTNSHCLEDYMEPRDCPDIVGR